MLFFGLDFDSFLLFVDFFSMDYGKVYVINNLVVWDVKLVEVMSIGKIVSILFVYFCISFVFNF